jgi:hypothetical protein
MRTVLTVKISEATGALVITDEDGQVIARSDGRDTELGQMERLEFALQHAMDEIAADGGYDVEANASYQASEDAARQ